jgi:hypothetical protein
MLRRGGTRAGGRRVGRVARVAGQRRAGVVASVGRLRRAGSGVQRGTGRRIERAPLAHTRGSRVVSTLNPRRGQESRFLRCSSSGQERRMLVVTLRSDDPLAATLIQPIRTGDVDSLATLLGENTGLSSARIQDRRGRSRTRCTSPPTGPATFPTVRAWCVCCSMMAPIPSPCFRRFALRDSVALGGQQRRCRRGRGAYRWRRQPRGARRFDR